MPGGLSYQKGAAKAVMLKTKRDTDFEAMHSLALPGGHGHFSPLMKAALFGVEAAVEGVGSSELDRKGSHGHTALMIGALAGRTEVCRILLAQGANSRDCATNGWTPLFFAAANGHLGVVELMLEQCDNVQAQLAHCDATRQTVFDVAKAGAQVYADKKGRHELAKLYVDSNHARTLVVLEDAAREVASIARKRFASRLSRSSSRMSMAISRASMAAATSRLSTAAGNVKRSVGSQFSRAKRGTQGEAIVKL